MGGKWKLSRFLSFENSKDYTSMRYPSSFGSSDMRNLKDFKW